MAYFSTGQAKVSNISSFGVGMNIKQLDNFAKDIGFNVKQIVKKINDTKNLQSKIDANWQGAARDAFIKDLNESVLNLETAIRMEYADFMSRLQNLADNMYKEDKNMYKQ